MATNDVARKAVDANGYNNGSKIVYQGTKVVTGALIPVINRTETVEAIEARLTDRFDDVRYYTGDSASG